MARLQAKALQVSDSEREILETIVRKRTSAQQQVIRARIILLASDGAALARRRWRESAEQEDVMARLNDRSQPGAPPTYTPEQVCAIVAIACERADEQSERPITHWSCRELADEAIKRGIVDWISTRAIGHFLKRSGPKTASIQRLADPTPR